MPNARTPSEISGDLKVANRIEFSFLIISLDNGLIFSAIIAVESFASKRFSNGSA